MDVKKLLNIAESYSINEIEDLLLEKWLHGPTAKHNPDFLDHFLSCRKVVQ